MHEYSAYTCDFGLMSEIPTCNDQRILDRIELKESQEGGKGNGVFWFIVLWLDELYDRYEKVLITNHHEKRKHK